jgi:hypothetical protein
MRNRRSLTIGGLAIVVALLPLTAAQSASVGGDLDGQDTDSCTPLTPTGTSYVRADGTTTADREPGTGTRSTFMTKSARTIAAIAPPAGFDPSTADATALKAFGIPARPTDPQVLKDWLAVWQGPTRDDGMPGRMCEHNKSSASIADGAWSGRLDRSGGFNTVTSTFKIPTFYAVCAHNSSHSIWNGIGGWGVSQLIQAGIDTS